MPLQIALPRLGLLCMQPGRPPAYRDMVIEGAVSSHYAAGFGHILVQEIDQAQVIMRLAMYSLKKKMNVGFTREECGLQTSAILRDHCRKTIIGAGRFKISEGYFSSLFTDAWRGILECHSGSQLLAFDTTWNVGFLEQFLPDDSEWWELFNNGKSSFPKIIGSPYRPITPALYQLVDELVYSRYDESLKDARVDHLVKEYLLQVLQQVANPGWLTQTLSKADAEKIEAAKELISADPYRHINTRELSRKAGLSECRLKALFMKATGMGTFDYMMYLRCTAVRERILHSNEPLKAFVKDAGYSDLANFVTGFKRHMGCTPAEIRNQR